MIEVYYVEDDEIIAKSVKQYLEQHNGKMSLFRTIADAKKAFTLSQPEYQILLLLMENKGKPSQGDSFWNRFGTAAEIM